VANSNREEEGFLSRPVQLSGEAGRKGKTIGPERGKHLQRGRNGKKREQKNVHPGAKWGDFLAPKEDRIITMGGSSDAT